MHESPSETHDPEIAPILCCAQEVLTSYKSSLAQPNNDHNALALGQDPQPHGNNHESTLALLQAPLPLQEIPMKRGRKQLQKPKELTRATLLSQEDVFKSHALVRRARIAYESLRLHYHREYMTNPQVRDATTADRSDISAFSELHKLGSRLLPYMRPDQRIVGSIPGIEVGDIFFYCAELCLLGLYGQTQAGIGYAPGVFIEENEPIAVSVVDSGGYEYNRELGEEVLLHTGSGGKHRNGSHMLADQSLQRGNLALECSMNYYGIEVRVIRGMPLAPHSSRKLYVYDGLY